MRITGGRLRGRPLASFHGTSIRPTSDKVRGAIFNLIGQDLTGVKALDLFAGTGSLGIEALSRGARRVLFVDASSRALHVVRKNLILCGCEGLGEVAKKDLTLGLPKGCDRVKGEIDLVFMDPPYGKGHIPPLLKELSEREILNKVSTVVAESSKEEVFPEEMGSFELVKTRTYGDTRVSIYCRK